MDSGSSGTDLTRAWTCQRSGPTLASEQFTSLALQVMRRRYTALGLAMHRLPPIVLLGVLALPAGLCGQVDASAISADVETVVSGGYWELGDSARGHLRAVIVTNGLEHLISQLRIEWILDPEESDQPMRLMAAWEADAIPDGISHLVDPTFALEGGTWILSVEAQNTHCDPPRVERYRIALAGPGQATSLGHTVIQPGCD